MPIDFEGMKAMLEGKPKPVAEDPHGLMLVVFYEGEGWVLCYAGNAGMVELILESSAYAEGGFSLKDAADIDYETCPGDGVFIAKLRVIDDGPGDWQGSREVAVQLHDMRKATADEWKAHLDGEWPWDPAQFEDGHRS